MPPKLRKPVLVRSLQETCLWAYLALACLPTQVLAQVAAESER